MSESTSKTIKDISEYTILWFTMEWPCRSCGERHAVSAGSQAELVQLSIEYENKREMNPKFT